VSQCNDEEGWSAAMLGKNLQNIALNDEKEVWCVQQARSSPDLDSDRSMHKYNNGVTN
jgi:hypothetical protein